ncbi:MAG TPA: methyltransferase domain-containing protein [Gemmatimonadales bacterium]|nr:methyltransferase domain-containing protein [Gemmatimonadales bacterium]
MTVASTPAIDLASIKRRQQTTWASGDYASVAARIPIVAERLCDAADIHAGDRVLDVATGTGNAALAAARCGAVVTGVDYVPALLDRGRIRATAEGLEVDYQEGDAEALPFADNSFDAVLSVFGVMFAPDQEKAAAELLRVCRPGGTIALACWTPDGFIGEMFRTMARHVPPPSGLRSPMEWGSEERLRQLFGSGLTALLVQPRTYTFRFRSAGEYVDFFRQYYGPTLKAYATMDEAGQQRLTRDLEDVVRRFDRRGSVGPIAVPGMYLEVIGIKGQATPR